MGLRKPVSGGGGGVRTARVVIGNTSAGWTEKDCDILCDGVNDQTKINEATYKDGVVVNRRVVLLDGYYKISGAIYLNEAVTLVGSGMAEIELTKTIGGFSGAITMYGGNCKIQGLALKQASGVSGSIGILQAANGFSLISDVRVGGGFKRCIMLHTSENIITNNLLSPGTTDPSVAEAIAVGDLDDDWPLATFNNLITNNIIIGVDSSIYVRHGQNSIVANNVCSNPNTNSIVLEEATNCLVSTNLCMGNPVVDIEGTGNSVWGNKHDAGDDLD